MTKLKSKKMTKSTFAVIIMAILMVAMLAFGGTYAWFTAKATTIKSEGITTGKILLTSGGSFIANTTVMPEDSLLDSTKAITLKADEGTDAAGEYVAVRVTVTIGSVHGTDDVEDLITVDIDDAWGLYEDATVSEDKKSVTYIYVYGTKDALTALTTTDGAVDVFDSVKFSATDNWTQGASASDNGYMGTTIELKVEARGLQVKNNTAATAADIVALFAAHPDAQ
jgi:predicted ribosomally synthesized peptide with SipW-like signal peptide